ncbi:signal-regulatory protein beta-1-like [Antechinus flavipes]|uniref:signal-regulatory protein beta-1-like n=1 Tax=Antechinus flavipes TaxID=38775 RepID=UPI0022355EA4|nr:signal-regulatory protein beta-1-like [Antechinus flavipes]
MTNSFSYQPFPLRAERLVIDSNALKQKIHCPAIQRKHQVTIKMSRLLPMPGSSLLSLLLTLFLGLSGIRSQEEFQVLQPDDHVSGIEGDTILLHCMVSDFPLVGPVKWFKGKEPQREEIFNFRDIYDRRKAIAFPPSNTNFSISISHITPEDAGTYYCVKFRKFPYEEFKSGSGTKLTVKIKPSVPLVSGPQERGSINQTVILSCNSTGFFPKAITLKWFKNGNEFPALWTHVFPKGDNFSYNLNSTVQVLLTASDVHSEITCEVHHDTLQTPLRGKMQLSDIIRIPPEIVISSLSFHSRWIAATCYVIKFYPKHLNVTWLMNGIIVKGEKSTIPTEDKDGTYSLESSLVVLMSVQKENTGFTCQVYHDSQPPINEILRASASPKDGTQTEPGSAVPPQILVIFLLGLKILLLLSVSIFFVHRKWKTTALKANQRSFRSGSSPDPQFQLSPAFRQDPALG